MGAALVDIPTFGEMGRSGGVRVSGARLVSFGNELSDFAPVVVTRWPPAGRSFKCGHLYIYDIGFTLAELGAICAPGGFLRKASGVAGMLRVRIRGGDIALGFPLTRFKAS